MQTSDKILNYLKFSGPSLPTAVAKNIKEQPLIASAYLGELKSSGKVKISKMKIGTSPLYYLSGQESQLQRFAGKVYSGRDYEVFEALRNVRVMRESQLDLLYKVALRKMPDFALPLQVDVGQGPEIFWRWYETTGAEVNQAIRSMLYGGAPAQEEVRAPAAVQTPPSQVSQNTVVAEQTSNVSIQQQAAPSQEQISQRAFTATAVSGSSSYPPNTTRREEENQSFSYPPNTANVPRGDSRVSEVPQAPVTSENQEEVSQQVASEPAVSESVPPEMALEQGIQVEETAPVQEIAAEKTEEQVEEKATVQSQEVKEAASEEQAAAPASSEVKEETQTTLAKESETAKAVEETKKENVAEKAVKQEALEDTEDDSSEIERTEVKHAPKSLVTKIKEKLMGSSKKKVGDFLPEVLGYFDKNSMNVDTHEVVRKNSEINLKVYVPSKIGKVMVFVKAKNKSRCDEKDLSAAYMEAQMEKMPLVFLYTGTLSRKAEEFLESGEFVNLLLLKLDLD